MGRKIAVDFGSTNTVVAEWSETLAAPTTLRLPGLSRPPLGQTPPLIPTLLYVNDGAEGSVTAGQAVRAAGYDVKAAPRFFASFKRGLAARAAPLPRRLDGEDWDEGRAGAAFLQTVARAVIAEGGPVEELVLTVPIQSFERYLRWLAESSQALRAERLRIVDEPTAAALGYQVREAGALILVFDFGGGSLDVALVRTPLHAGAGSGIVLELARSLGLAYAEGDENVAAVIAKSGRVLGGDDVDQWLLEDVLKQHGLGPAEARSVYPQLKAACEAAKIRLSSRDRAEIGVFDPDAGRAYRAVYNRARLEEVLEAHNFYANIQKELDKVMRAARQRGLFKEDIESVLLVGGSSLIPSVQELVRHNFGPVRVHEHLPFEAVAHGALSLATGTGLEDYLYHSYGLRHLDPLTGRHAYEEIIAPHTRYPITEPIELTLRASTPGQTGIEMVIGELEASSTGLTEVYFGEHQIVLVDEGTEQRRVVALNDQDGARTIAQMDPPGRPGRGRGHVYFTVDSNRTLRVTVKDILTGQILLHNAAVVELR